VKKFFSERVERVERAGKTVSRERKKFSRTGKKVESERKARVKKNGRGCKKS